MRILVAIASYGHANDLYLDRVINEYRSMQFDVDVVVLSNIEKAVPPAVECLVGLPTKDPWSLPFLHKKLFLDRLNLYDLFIYSEDDILITEENISAFLDVGSALKEDEIVGFLRVEYGPDGERNFPEVHGHFRWDCESVRVRGGYTLAHFTNEHSACNLLTRQQLTKAIASGGFLVAPHEGEYDLLCSAATDPYTQCGFRKLIPISHIEQFWVHHLPNKYIGHFGVDQRELGSQISALLLIASQEKRRRPLLNTETSLWHKMYSKDCYEPIRSEVLSLIPKSAERILSIGSASGANELWLLETGKQVVAVPLDDVISSKSAARGLQVVSGDLDTARAKISSMRFDCILFLNVLQFVDRPEHLLRLFVDALLPGGVVLITAPNRPYVRYRWQRKGGSGPRHSRLSFETTRIHNTSSSVIRRWCVESGLSMERTSKVDSPRTNGSKQNRLSALFASEVVALAKRVPDPNERRGSKRGVGNASGPL
ncbi:bifunctional 2-polyprenyl-6-hydroxyphenol methylase/3-demethylubiquinol 3-O-methyltransferase UbiG [Bradyrhizobium sp. WSM2793]|uniref:class I SAM-dependent methyltransferase n=1 Tax=Bradyrhizobium sp. WSM2793 TaxID=1038866 RepID=UPI00035FD538|nr:methionine biosynthesis protein MetW [Bradyrhizobium sp. WSM2793]